MTAISKICQWTDEGPESSKNRIKHSAILFFVEASPYRL
jgi:hypothetical protein